MWNKLFCSAFYEKFIRDKEEKRYQKSLVDANHAIDVAKPKSLSSVTLKTKMYYLQEKQSKIEKSNERLMKRMLDIDSKPPFFTKIDNETIFMKRKLYKVRIKASLDKKIKDKNQEMMKKLVEVKPHYVRESFNKEYQYHQKLKKIHDKSYNQLFDQRIKGLKGPDFYDKLLNAQLKKRDLLKEYAIKLSE